MFKNWTNSRFETLPEPSATLFGAERAASELFGHERGAFTGADRQQKGKLEMADGGTVFLDEIGDMSLPLQAKLLRVLQDREFHRVGGSKTVSVNIRIIAATNKDLKKAVKAGQFREDLYFRLNVITFTLPPLPERRGDIPALARFFLDRHTKDAKRPGMAFSNESLNALAQYPWPGNIRELDNVIARAVVLSPTDTIEPTMLALTPDDAELGTHDGAHPPYFHLPYHESLNEHGRFIIARGQFMPGTGKTYGLRQDWWYDGRQDVLAATDAALDYLQFLYGMFNDWELSLAAYNWGEGAVARALLRNQAKGLPIDYHSLRVPDETRGYVPKLQAVKNIIRDPAAYGLDLESVPNSPYFETVTTSRPIDVKVAASLAEITVEEFVALNPGHRRPVIAAEEPQTLLLPVEKVTTFLSNLEDHDKPLVTWKIHHLRPGESLDRVAARYGISAARLRLHLS